MDNKYTDYDREFMGFEYAVKLEEAGHLLQRDEYFDIDFFAFECGFHNGPRCVNCNEEWCTHCNKEIKKCEAAK